MDEQLITFGPEMDNRVPGELIVKLTAQGNLSVTASIPAHPSRRVAGPLPTAFGIDALDQVLSDLNVASITKVHGPMPSPAVMAEAVRSLAVDLSGTYRLQLADPTTDLASAAQRLSAVESVAEVSPNYYRFALVTPSDPMYGVQWGLVKINCPDAWTRTTGSTSTVVAVVDTGVDLDHPDLQPQLLAGQDLVDLVGVAPEPGWHFEGDFLTRDNDAQDEVGHGSHVAGTIAAVTNNAVGVAGIAWQCRILPVKVLARMVRNSDGAVTGIGTSVDIAAGIRWAADHGAHIINMSLGGYNDTFVERDAVAYAVGKDVLVVAAMGNDNTSSVSYPAGYPDVVAVGAITQTDARASFSNFGPHIAVVAPGVGIRSTTWDNTYVDMSGTSMATPHVSGVAALIKSCSTGLTNAQIAQILRETARNLKDNPADPVPNDRYGYGVVDAKAAIDRACPAKLKFADEPVKKVRDDIKLKFRDDHFKKIIDDVKFKFRDDPAKKIVDEIPRKRIADQFPIPQPGPVEGPAAAAAAAAPGGAADWESLIADYEDAIAQLQAALEQGTAAPEEAAQLEALLQDYQALISQYQAMGGAMGAAAGVGDYESLIAQYEAALRELQTAMLQGTASAEDMAQYQSLMQDYQGLVSQYQGMAAGAVPSIPPPPPAPPAPLVKKVQDDPAPKKLQDDPAKKVQDDPPKKLRDDPPKKVQDDPKKLRDDPPKKFRDDIKKFRDDPPKKLRDDAKKFRDDPPKKFRDDIKKFRDDPPKKFRDDAKKVQDDPKKLRDDVGKKYRDDIQPPTPGPTPGPTPDPAPFALATPHHSMAWAGGYAAGGGGLAEYANLIAQYEAALSQLQAAVQQGTAAAEETAQYAALMQEYQRLVAEYQRLQGQG